MRVVFRSSRLLGLALLLPWISLTLFACAGDRTESGDEEPGDTRTEIVYVLEDSSRDRSTVPESREAERPESPPPSVEAGEGDDQAAASPAPAGDRIPFDPKGEYTVQVGTFADSTRAVERLRELQALGYPAYGLASDRGVRIRIGYFGRRDEADRFGQRFSREHGGQFWVDRRASEKGSRP